MSNLLIDEHPLQVLPALAKLIGLNEAIVLQQIHYWLKYNESKNEHYIGGRYWTYNTIENWQAKNFPFWSLDTVKRTFTRLRTMGLLIIGNHNSMKQDRTIWYSIDYDRLAAVKDSGAKVQIALMQKGKLPQPLPETTTETRNTNTIEDRYDITESIDRDYSMYSIELPIEANSSHTEIDIMESCI